MLSSLNKGIIIIIIIILPVYHRFSIPSSMAYSRYC